MSCCCCCCGGKDGPVNALLRLYCRSRCNGKLVAAALSFHPPNPPFYQLINHSTTDPSTPTTETQPNSKNEPPTSTTSIQHSHHSIVFDECIGMADVLPTMYQLPSLSTFSKTQSKTKHPTKMTVAIYARPQPKYVLLYSHGNATDIGAMHAHLVSLSAVCNLTVVCYDYNGYGASTGIPSEKSAYLNIETVYRFLLEQKIVTNPADELILYGESIGSGPAVWLSTKRSVAGLILQGK